MEKTTVKNTGKYRIIVFTGAGISKKSGIPTFDETPGIRDKLSRWFAMSNPDEYKAVIDSFVETISKAEPNAAHHAIAKYGLPVITMNIDKLHERAAIDPNQTIVAVHGNFLIR